jgi:MarR family transcriptional regulator for hemolysin
LFDKSIIFAENISLMEQLDSIIFYSMDKAIKSYRQYAQKQLKAAGFDITIDQWLVLKAIEEDNTITQQYIAEKVFKDVASITRIIELLVKNGFLTRHFHNTDRRRFNLQLTAQGKDIIEKLKPYTAENRKKALQGLSAKELTLVKQAMEKIIENVSS